MAQVFHINKGATLPTLKMEVINDGRNDFWKIFLALQNCDVRFSMWNSDTGIYKIANAKAEVVYDDDGGCEDKYYIQYNWKKRDTNEPGKYNAQFKIMFSDNIEVEDYTLPYGDLIVPVAEDLVVEINDAMKKF